MIQDIQQIEERFKKLPKDIQSLLASEDLGLITQVIGEDVGITPEQALDVEDGVVTVLMGFSHPKDFIRNIQTKIGVDQEKARAIAERVNEEIFQQVKDSLKIVHGIKDEEVGGASGVSLAPAPSIIPQSTTPLVAPKPPTPPTNTPQETHSAFPQMIVPPKINMEIMQKPQAPKPPAPIMGGSASAERGPQNIFEQKLQGVFKMPKEETLVPPKPPSPIPPPTPRSPGVDPYKEPIQ